MTVLSIEHRHPNKTTLEIHCVWREGINTWNALVDPEELEHVF
jgi:hypothetical protein